MVNGFTAQDHWRLGFSIHLHQGDPTEWTIELPREEKVIGLTVATNQIYHKITRLKLIFDGREDDAVILEIEPREGPQTFNFDPRPATEVTYQILDWTEDGRSDVIGIDDMQLRVQRPQGFERRVIPMLNIGGLVKYPRGDGGLILNQYRIMEQESNPLNKEKKQTVIATILRNLGAPFSGAKAVVAGAGLAYDPLSLEDHANVYLTTDQGWPDRRHDLSALPIGRQSFRSVPYEIRDFTTSPLESGVTLRHNRLDTNAQEESVSIAVGAKADALFFLHTFHQTRSWRPGRQPEPPIVFEYLVRYADGSEQVVPVRLKRGVEHYIQDEHRALPNAAVAWQADSGDQKAGVYQYQWNNPNPDRTIESVTLRYGSEHGSNYGAPVLLGLTAASRIE
jgi:beta-galactosidase